MRTTKKIVSAVLAVCMLASTSIVTSFAATDTSESVGADTKYTTAAQEIDDKYAYNGDDLGATYTKDNTIFKLWSPTATEVKVNIYTKGSDNEDGSAKLGTYTLEKVMENNEWTGLWSVNLSGNWKNYYYTYSITTTDTTHMGSDTTKTYETQDVYSKAVGVNGNRSMIVDLNDTNPDGWDNDQHILLDKSTSSQVYELHIKDFSYDKDSGVSDANRGKYLAFTENGTTLKNEGELSTCIDYLKQLGITTVQLNPFYDFQSIDESKTDDQFNWGYDPQNYNVPEGSYSSDPYDGNVRIKECKEMIKALHDAGISVVMDVVYNHTYSTDSCFQKTVPDYYYRMNADGTFSNGSGCGNEGATERAMYRNFVIQSVLYWVNEYHVDGFRFDLMGLMDVETMNMIRDALDKVDSRITTWGEGWTGGTSNYPKTTCTGEPFYQAIQANSTKLNARIAFFNDSIRNAIKGSALESDEKGFVQGNEKYASGIRYGARANTKKYNWLAQAPSQCVTYDACHDNATLYDKIICSTDLANYDERSEEAVKMNKMAGAMINASQGITFMLAGEEMCRTKYGDTNSYKSSPEINKIKWQNLVDYADVISYYKGLIQIKKSFTPLTSMDNTYFDNFTFGGSRMTEKSNQVSYVIKNDQPGEWNTMAVIYNSASTEAEVTLPSTTTVNDWVIIANGDIAGLDSLGEVTGTTFKVPAYATIIAVDKEGYESAGLKSNMGKVVVNYLYEKNDQPLKDALTLQGQIGSNYQTPSISGIDDTYVLDRVEGDEKGQYSEDTKTVTYYFKDYVPESITNADFNNDGVVDVLDITTMQKYLINPQSMTPEIVEKLDLNYDGTSDVRDITMLQKYLAGFAVSKGSVEVNYYYLDASGNKKEITPSKTITGKVGSDYSTEVFRVVGYSVDETSMPKNANGIIPYGETLQVNYKYSASSPQIKIHVKHNGSLTWDPTLWIWGSDLSGKDKGNYSGGTWPGVTLENKDADGWYEYSFTYEGAGTYNLIVSNNATNQTSDYKGFVDNELWIVINDDLYNSSAVYFTPYTDNPDTNPDAPIAQYHIG